MRHAQSGQSGRAGTLGEWDAGRMKVNGNHGLNLNVGVPLWDGGRVPRGAMSLRER